MIKEMNPMYPKAFKEISEIIKFFPASEYEKIPKSFIDLINENKDDSYEYKVEHMVDVHNQEMLEETRIILSMIYRDYIASNEEILQTQQTYKTEEKELLQEESKKNEEYNPDTIIEKQETKNEPEDNATSNEIVDKIESSEVVDNSTSMVVYKESLLKKIINWIKGLFKKKNLEMN